jgi:hypothetical protein
MIVDFQIDQTVRLRSPPLRQLRGGDAAGGGYRAALYRRDRYLPAPLGAGAENEGRRPEALNLLTDNLTMISPGEAIAPPLAGGLD